VAEFQPVPFRIRIGVTGHRKLNDEAAVSALVKKAIDTRIEELYAETSRELLERVRKAGTTPIAYAVVSPLAEGADRVVARAVLNCRNYRDTRLDAVLPLVVEDYLEDFKIDNSKTEFHKLLTRCRRPIILRSVRIATEAQSADEAKLLRNLAYERVGRYVVDHCDVLIAIWDGEESRGRGGTAEIIKYAEEQGRPVIRIWREQCTIHAPGNGLDASALEGVDRFNRLKVSDQTRATYLANLERDYFEEPKTAKDVPDEARQIVRKYLFPYYVQASLPAKENRDRFHRAGRFIYLLSAAAVACVALAVLAERFSRELFAAEFITLGAAWYFLRKSPGWHIAWMENRFLTERIRCGIFMALSGVDTAPIEVLPFMGGTHTVNDWMVRVFDEIWNRLPPLQGCSAGQCLAINKYIGEAWLGEQIRYHTGKQEKEGKLRRRLERAGHILLPVTMAAALFHIAWGALPASVQDVHRLHEGLTFLAILFPAVAGALAGLQAQREHLRLEKRSGNMKPQLENLRLRLASATEPPTLERLLHEVDEIMLRETQDWLMLMRYVGIKGAG
jgi:hypothetical protein